MSIPGVNTVAIIISYAALCNDAIIFNFNFIRTGKPRAIQVNSIAYLNYRIFILRPRRDMHANSYVVTKDNPSWTFDRQLPLYPKIFADDDSLAGHRVAKFIEISLAAYT